MAGALADARRAPLRARAEALQRRALVGVDLLHVQVVARPGRGCSPRWRPRSRAAARGRARRRAGCGAAAARASSTDLPRTWSITSRALRAEERTYFAWARTTGRCGAGRASARGAAAAPSGRRLCGASASAAPACAAAGFCAAAPWRRLGLGRGFGRRRFAASARPCALRLGLRLRPSSLGLRGFARRLGARPSRRGLRLRGRLAASRSALRLVARRRLALLVLLVRHRHLTLARPVGAGVAAEGARRRELAELVADHRLADEHRHVLAAVVHGDRVPDHLGEDRRGARPGLDHVLLAALVHLLDALHQALLDPRALLGRTSHLTLPPRFPRRRPRTMYLSDGLPFLRVR